MIESLIEPDAIRRGMEIGQNHVDLTRWVYSLPKHAQPFAHAAVAKTSARLVGAKMTPTIADEVACRVHAIMLDHVHRAEIINLDW